MDRYTKRQKRNNTKRNEDRVRDCMMRAADEMEIKEYDKAAKELDEAASFARICWDLSKGEA